MLALGHCDVFLATSHSMFTFLAAKTSQRLGRTARQLSARRRDHEAGAFAKKVVRAKEEFKVGNWP